MKRNLFAFLLFSLFGFSVNSQVTNSVLSNGTWYKFAVDTTGVFKIDANLLQDIGLTPSSINPRNIHIYGNGGQMLPTLNAASRYDDLQENAIFISGEEDGVFNNEDYILFYAKGPHDWNVNVNGETATHRQNIYSDKGFYFITVNGTPGKRIGNANELTGSPVQSITTFDDFVFYEKEEINLFAAGNKWLGEDFGIENQQSFQLLFPNPVASQNLKIAVRAVAVSGLSSVMNVNANGNDVFPLDFSPVASGSSQLASDVLRNAVIPSSGQSVNFSLTYDNKGNPSAKAYLDYIEVVGKKELVIGTNQFSFRSFQAAKTNGLVNFQLQGGGTGTQIWDVTDPINPKIIQNTENSGFGFLANGGSLSEYVLLTNEDYYIPEAITDARVDNQNLHAVKDINYLVITNSELAPQAQRLADYHANNSGLTTEVINVEEIFIEFGSGSRDITAIRDFIRFVYDNNTSTATKLKYVCFFGDASYDYKDRIQGNNNIVPVYESDQSYNLAFSYVTDDYYAMLENHEGSMDTSHTLDVATGRIPVSTVFQAEQVVNKILSYYTTTSLGEWRNTITLLADDIDANSDINIQSGVEDIADAIKINKPLFNVAKIYADSYVQQNSSGGERYPEVKEAITRAIEKGTLIFDYFGHGGEDGFASERFLDREMVQNFNNPNTLPLFITVTCEFSRFDNPARTTAGELTFWNANGGAASMITTTREVFITVGQSFNEDLVAVLLENNDEDLTIAESLAKAKNGFGNFQKYFIYHFGDPAKKLAVPEPNVKITKMNGVDVTQSLDTLKALSKVRFEGVVTNSSDQILTDYNGTLSTIVFDKPIDKTTLDNDGFGINLDFDSQESSLFRGKSTIENGQFNFEFIVPKDIRVAFGKGKLSFYAEDSNSDKGGFNKEVIVGGIDENAPEDTVGPEIQLFMNDESFLDGGNTNGSPNLIAKFSDSSGINTSVTAVDHDIVAILDGDEANPYVLNDFYETELNDFTKGSVTFKFRDLSPGLHTITLKAWDTYNNSSEATLTFVVVSDTSLTLDNVLNYPNPFVNYTEFWFNHNKPNEPLQVQVQIFTVSGKLIKTINQLVQTTGNLSRNITWNGLDDFGHKIGKGVYVYKLKVKSTVTNITAEKYEKLVIL